MKPILDVACGSRMFWFDKNNPNAIFNDRRKEKHILCDGRKLEINPDTQYDFRKLGFKDGQFKLVVFDPPHLRIAGEKGWQRKKYGVLEETWREDLKAGVNECFRVLDTYGVLIFKWHEHSFKVSEVLKAIDREPLFGHKTTANGKTVWLTFMKF